VGLPPQGLSQSDTFGRNSWSHNPEKTLKSGGVGGVGGVGGCCAIIQVTLIITTKLLYTGNT
jgi:hypothetical protein